MPTPGLFELVLVLIILLIFIVIPVAVIFVLRWPQPSQRTADGRN